MSQNHKSIIIPTEKKISKVINTSDTNSTSANKV